MQVAYVPIEELIEREIKRARDNERVIKEILLSRAEWAAFRREMPPEAVRNIRREADPTSIEVSGGSTRMKACCVNVKYFEEADYKGFTVRCSLPV
nr:hypothetical protein 8 [Deltaproteobacteria bacterium]